MKFELTENQLSNLLVFMERVDLKGNEALSFMEIIQSLQSQFEEQHEQPEENNE